VRTQPSPAQLNARSRHFACYAFFICQLSQKAIVYRVSQKTESSQGQDHAAGAAVRMAQARRPVRVGLGISGVWTWDRIRAGRKRQQRAHLRQACASAR
jgi:hypothetical protein